MEGKKIYIVGAGAIGKVLAVFLKLEKRDVVLVRGSVDNGPAYEEPIAVELPDGTKVEALVEVSTLSQLPVLDGTVVLTNKSFANEEIGNRLYGKTGSHPLVLLQNGLNVESPFINLGFPQIFRCVLFATSQPQGKGVYRYRPVAPSPIGLIKGNAAILDNIVRELDTKQFSFTPEMDIHHHIWTKAIVNSVFNSICPLLAIDNGVFCREPAALEIAKRVIVECVRLAGLKGIFLDADKVMNTLLLISRSSDGQFISTHLDIVNGRRTEIGTLNLAFVEIARSLAVEPALKETALLGELVNLKSQIGLSKGIGFSS